MGSVLIAMPKSEDSERILRMIQSRGMGLDIEICQTGADVLRISNDRDFGVVICTKRLRDMSYSELSEYLPTCFSMILLTSDSSLDPFGEHVMKLLLPVKSGELSSTIEMLTEGFVRKKKKNPRISKTRNEEEKKIIDRAKMLLMGRNGLEEQEAYRYIRRNSMDTGRTILETAEMILLMNEA